MYYTYVMCGSFNDLVYIEFSSSFANIFALIKVQPMLLLDYIRILNITLLMKHGYGVQKKNLLKRKYYYFYGKFDRKYFFANSYYTFFVGLQQINRH